MSPVWSVALSAVVAAAALGSGVVPAAARSSLVSEVDSVATRYHEDPTRLDRLYAELTEAVNADPDVSNLVALSRIAFVWGDVRARSGEQKLDAYDRGREAGRRAIELEPQNALARLWYAINGARWGQTRGIVRSLFMLPTLREEIRILLDLAPNVAAVQALAGNVDYEVPGPLGGDLARAEAAFRRGLDLDANFTGLRVGLAKVLIKTNRIPEARRELQAVLDAKAPSNVADWSVKDTADARRLLESIRRR
jgi:tetratricopeptide (TPR) repeat protein